MNVGMLWLDDDPDQNVDARVRRGAEHFRRTVGRLPNVVVLHPNAAGRAASRTAGLLVQSSRDVQPNHAWIGIRE